MDDLILEVPRRATSAVVGLLRETYGLSLVGDWFVRFGPRTVGEILEHANLTGERRERAMQDILSIIRAHAGEDRRSLPLNPDEWELLERIATETGSRAERGMTAGASSWRTLIRRIANGELRVISNEE